MSVNFLIITSRLVLGLLFAIQASRLHEGRTELRDPEMSKLLRIGVQRGFHLLSESVKRLRYVLCDVVRELVFLQNNPEYVEEVDDQEQTGGPQHHQVRKLLTL